MEKPHFTPALLHPRYWPVWLGMGFWALLTQLLPFRVQMLLGGWIGRLAACLSPSRRIVARKNLALCFPDLSEKQREELFWQSMESIGRGLFDTAVAWFWPYFRQKKIIEVQGLEHLVEAQAKGQGVLFIGVHFTSLEIAGPGVNRNHPYPIFAVYRPHNNAAYDYIQAKGRERVGSGYSVLSRNDARGMVKVLRSGAAVSYLPDQDYGHKHSVFAPFFGIEAATIASAGQLLKLGKAVPIGYTAVRKRDHSGYLVRIHPQSCFEGLGQGDDVQDAEAINRFVQERVMEYPEQFLWVHRRFKSRPDHDRDFYGLRETKAFKKRQKRRKKQQELQDKSSSKSTD
ncbi:Lipid A biosynthesis palmitoleoyltransferase [Thalassocella blandensis]|nr:Lipid A biosynthesis palmitoleoyltransferase [Thalassocella blandensis]